jgi:tetrapyrrole methylase family protein/MazG family protein
MDEDEIIEELGDVLLQVVFHAQIGKEQGYFNINDVIKGITNKMINRHPHIFKHPEIKDSQEILEIWDDIKSEEKGFVTYTDTLKHVPKNFPGLMRADKIQRKAAKVGFDFDSVEPAMEKVLEELQELKDVYKGKNRAKIVEEVGDLVFSTANVARLLDIDPEVAVNYTIDKFIERFQYIEESARGKGLDLVNMSLAEMDVLWNESKQR